MAGKGSGELRSAVIKYGAVLGIGAVLGVTLSNMGGNDYADTLRAQTDRAMAGQPFDTTGFRIETQSNPDNASVMAAKYQAYQNLGEHNPSNPSEVARATVICAFVGANALNAGEQVHIQWDTARRLGQNDRTPDEQVRAAYEAVVADCEQVMDAALGAHVPALRLPVMAR